MKGKICYISSMMLFFLSFVSFLGGLISMSMKQSMLLEWVIVEFNSLSLSVLFLFDWMALFFLSVVLLISGSVLYYSESYMMGEHFMERFIMLVLLFVFSMSMLILSPSLISILLGWDGLGLVSYCLVIYYQNKRSYNAGMLTGLSNRVGDVCLLMAIAYLFSYGSWNLVSMENSLVLISMLVMVGGMTKSAQIPFSAWLPAAMAAPTPVSALVHSSTLVTAGVYLLIRFFHVFEGSYELKIILLVLSSLTMFMAGIGACFEMDFKKIIALSTLSQLGLMMMVLSLGGVNLAYFHLLSHALFKALLFMCAGKIIHISGGNQDIRFLGGLGNLSSLTGVSFLSANLALCGFPFMAGFYSKDLILESYSSSVFNWLIFLVLLLSSVLTCVYTFRVGGLIMFKENSSGGLIEIEDDSSGYFFPLIVLLFGAVLGGSVFNWLLMEEKMFYFLGNMQCWPFIVFLVGMMMGWSMMEKFYKNLVGQENDYFKMSMWYLPFLSSQNLIFFKLDLGAKVMWEGDMMWSEVIGGQKGYDFLMFNSKGLQMMQNNSLKFYLMVIFLWILIFYYFMN